MTLPTTVTLPRILAIETSGHAGSVALGLGSSVLAERELPGDRRTARELAPAIQEVLASIGWSPEAVTLVAVTIGPGSFTGLRLGVTTAKAFAYAVEANIVGIDVCDVLVAQAEPLAPSGAICTAIDAQRGEYFAARYERSGANATFTRALVQDLQTASDFVAMLSAGDLVTGPALAKLGPLPSGVTTAPDTACQPQARTLLDLATRAWQAGRKDDVFTLLPKYYRASAAEEKAAEEKAAAEGKAAD